MGKESTSERLTRIPVSKVHFLIHPGFISEPIHNKDLLNRYVEQARGMQPDEIMIVMLHGSLSETFNDFKAQQPYTKTLSELRRVLGKRLIAISDSGVNKNNSFLSPESYQIAAKMAERRGYYIDKEVKSEVYGETHGICVLMGGQVANNALGLRQKTSVLAELTSDPHVSHASKAATMQNYSRLQYPFKAE